MRRISARACAAAVAVVLGLLAQVVPANADDTDGLPTLQILSPSAGSTLSGVVDVSVQIDQSSATYFISDLSINIASATEGDSNSKITIAPGDCQPTCVKTISVDTTAWEEPDFSGVPWMPPGDGPVRINAWANVQLTNSWTSVSAPSVAVVLDNRRPTVDLPDYPADANGSRPDWVAPKGVLTLNVLGRPSTTSGSPIDHYAVLQPKVGLGSPRAFALAAPPGGSGQLTLDLTGQYFGYHNLYVIAFDRAGVPSEPVTVSGRTYRPYAVTTQVTVNSSYRATIDFQASWTAGGSGTPSFDSAYVELDGTDWPAVASSAGGGSIVINDPMIHLPIGKTSLQLTTLAHGGVPIQTPIALTVKDVPSVTLEAPYSASTWGKAVTFHGSTRDLDGAALSIPFSYVLESRQPGDRTWHPQARVTSRSAEPAFTVRHLTTGNARWRVRIVGTALNLAATSNVVTVPVAAAFSHVPSKLSVKVNRRATIRAKVTPVAAGTKVTLQHRECSEGTCWWQPVATGRVAASGRVAISHEYRKADRGSWNLVVQHNSRSYYGQSAAWKVAVS